MLTVVPRSTLLTALLENIATQKAHYLGKWSLALNTIG
jgi:hypothetical protein